MNHNTGNFSNLAEFAHSVKAYATGKIDPRLMAQATYGNSEIGSEGGFAIPAALAEGILTALDGDDSLARYCRTIEVDSNRISLPVDEIPAWNTTSGIYAAWQGEAEDIPAKKPKLNEVELSLHRLKCLVPVTEELQQDAPALSAWLEWKFGEAVREKMNSAIIAGTGLGQPLGILKAGALITVAKESGQAAGSLVGANLLRMFQRLLASSHGRSIWICNPDTLLHLASINLENGSPAFQSGNGSTIIGRPVVWSESASALGTVGDVMLADLGRFLILKRKNDPSIAKSLHVWWDQDLAAFRLIYRANAQPLLSAPVTPPNSSLTRSGFVTLETRA
jgi:HK97 family phage major capsid protein